VPERSDASTFSPQFIRNRPFFVLKPVRRERGRAIGLVGISATRGRLRASSRSRSAVLTPSSLTHMTCAVASFAPRAF
jgi:hypothetical protein